jgi:NCS1 family nucleobase:cation symporter-1
MYIADYYIFRKKKLDVMSLFTSENSKYWYNNGINNKAIITWIAASILPFLGKFIQPIHFFYDNGWIIGFIIALVIYPALMKSETSSLVSDEEEAEITER